MVSELMVEPIFATPLATCKIEGDPTLTFEKMKEIEWDEGDGIHSSHYNFLREHPILEDQILEAFFLFKTQYLGLSSVGFAINSSWMTYTEPGAVGNNHRHYNSFYTGVYYPFPGVYSPLEINRLGTEPHSFLLPYEVSNIFNNQSCYLVPEQNTLVFFPSHLMHKILKNQTEEPRYSLAFTLHPCGELDTKTESSTYLWSQPLD